MTTFLDHKDNEYEAQTVIKATNAVNGERSLTGTIYTNEEVLNKIDKGWKIKFQDEFYRVIFAKPIDTGNKIQVDFDAVHQFFYDFDKSSVHSQLPDGSHTFLTYLDFIFSGSGYTYNLEVTVNALNKQSFGYKSRLDLFNDIVKSSGIEFFVSGKVVRILQKTGTDLSTIVRKNFNMNELGIEKKINDFVTYQKGFGAWNNKDDHSKGRLEVEYISPLASEYGIIEAEPLVDERYTNADSLLASLKQNVDSSYSISVQIDMEDLTKAGYQYTQPVAGDYIMAINETVGFKEKIRIVSFTSEYDVTGKLISHKVTCNDIGTVKKQSNVVNRLSGQLNSNETKLIEIESTAKEALVSADGKNTNYYGTEMPVDSPKGTLKTGDLLFLTVGDTTKQYYWNGAEWIINPFSNDIDFVKKDINDKISEVNGAIKDGDDALNQKYDEIVAKTISQDTLISQAQSTADSARADATTALSNIVSESQKLTEQINALSKIEGDHYTATNQTLTQLDGTVKGLQTDYTALVNKDNEITQTLTNYKQTIDQNTASITENKKATDGTISSLQTQVTQNKNDIATKASQLTVDNLSGRMSSAETTITQNANEISTRLSQTNIESLITSKATVITDNKVKETSESFSREITRVEGLVGGMSVGSVNYIVKSNKQFTDKGVKASGITVTVTDGILHVESVAGNGNYLNFDWLGRYSEYLTPAENKFNEGDDFTITFWCKRISGTGNPNVYIKSGMGYYPLSGELNATEFKPISYTGKWKKANVINLHLGFYNVVGVFEFEKFKLSKGNITTDWSPSPEDMVMLTSFNTVKDTVDSHTQQIGQQGSSLTTTIQRVDSIQSSVSSIDGRLSTVTQTADGLVTTVQNLSVGGTNLVLDSEKERIIETYGTIDVPLRKDVILPLIGHDLTYSFEAKALVDGTHIIDFYFRDSKNGGSFDMSQQLTLTGEYQRFYVTKKLSDISSNIANDLQLRFRGNNFVSGGSGNVNGFAIKKIKIETGNMATDYSPAPEDFQSQITSLQTTVTQTANSWAVKNLTSGGSILGQINLTDGTVKIDGKYVKITGQTLIDNGIITNAMIKDLTADKIIGGTIDANKISVINLNASNITSGQISGGLIKGGVLTALNGAMSIDLNNGQINTSQDTSSIRRTSSDSASQFIRFEDGGLNTVPGGGIKAAHTIVGSNYRGNESTGDGFAGLEIYSGHYENFSRLIGDRIEFRANQSGKSINTGNWVFDFRNQADSFFYPQKGDTNHKNMFLGHPSSRITNVFSLDYNISDNGVSVVEYLKSLGLCMRHILNGGFSDNTISAIRTERDKTLYKLGGGI
ncbi:phage tail protein [Streptococcus uberis]|uniref:phage tail protein n=1 Tax=Streptococcus uberis TaxID=1349 RepID=UPI00193A0966|nr:phage tail protein [Streptococcus uberis]